MAVKKNYIFSKTMPLVAAVIAKVRLMQVLTAKEELIYLTHVKNIFKGVAKKIINAKKIIKPKDSKK